MNFVFQHVFYCHVYHRSLRFISYHEAMMAKENEYHYLLECSALKCFTAGAFVVPFRVLSRKKLLSVANVLFKNW